MTPKDFFIAFLGKTLNLPAEKVTSLFTNDEGTEVKPDALETLLTADATRVQAFKTENQKFFDNGVKKGTKEALTDLEKGIKEKFGVNSEKQGLELVDEIVATKVNATGELDANKVKIHPLYTELENKMKNAVKETETQWQKKYGDFESKVVREKTLSGVLKKADALLPEFELPKDEKIRANQKTLLVNELNQFGYQVNGEEIIVLDAEGKAVEDGHGNKKAFDTIVKEIAGKYWPKIEGQGRQGAGGSNDPAGKGKQGSAWAGKVPTNEAEYSSMIAGAKTPEERIAITDAYDAAQSK